VVTGGWFWPADMRNGGYLSQSWQPLYAPPRTVVFLHRRHAPSDQTGLYAYVGDLADSTSSEHEYKKADNMASRNLTLLLCLMAVWVVPSSVPASVVGVDGSTRFGTLGRNPFRGPFQQNWDVSIAKIWTVTENQNLKFSADLFNVWNHPVFDKPSITDIESPSFGQITNTVGNPRLMQFSLRYAF
jgi:hypothetical protein